MIKKMIDTTEKIRVDKWLWAARFFKTRSLASQAVNGGKVHFNGSRMKSSRLVGAGDELEITKAQTTFSVTILTINSKRRPASEAKFLYEESEDSIQKREEERDLRRMAFAGQTSPAKKPGKRDRRKIKEFIRKE